MTYTLDSLRALARGKDERLMDVEAYPDSWIDTQIQNGFEVAEDAKQVFVTKDVYDLTDDINNSLDTVTITLNENCHSIYGITVDESINVEITYDNTVIVTIPENASMLVDKTITIRYWYYPMLPFESIDMKLEVYHLFRHSLYINLFGSLRDKESEMYHQAQVDRFVREGTFTVPQDFEESTSSFTMRGFV